MNSNDQKNKLPESRPGELRRKLQAGLKRVSQWGRRIAKAVWLCLLAVLMLPIYPHVLLAWLAVWLTPPVGPQD